jgi:hypothetical protein
MYVISQAVYDDCSLPLFQELVGNNESYYLWSCDTLAMDRFLQSAQCQSPVVFVGIKDMLHGWSEFNWWQDRQQSGVISIEGFARRHPDTQIVLFTSVEQLENELSEPNLHIIAWGGDWTNQRAEYSLIEPVLDKNFDSDNTYISLNRHVRAHRLVALSYLFGQEYNRTGVITYLNNPNGMPQSFLDTVGWQFGPTHDVIRESILRGFDHVKNNNAVGMDNYNIYQEYGQGATDNAGNFENRLRAMYRDSFVEIVSESVFAAPSFMITEKTAHSFYGCNFPIILGGCGIVVHLKELGFDMFDDVIDHSYDTIANPFDRIVAAIELNRALLLDTEHAKSQWKQCRSRFINNVDTIRNIYSWYENRTRTKLTSVLEQMTLRTSLGPH